MNQGNPPPNWYPDPRGEAELRYWDGSQWTEHTHAGQATQAAPAPAAPPPSTAPPPQAAAPAAATAQGYQPGGGYGGGGYGGGATPAGGPGSTGGGKSKLPLIIGGVVALLALGLILALVLSGGDDAPSEEDKVKEAAEEVITTKETSACKELATQDYLEKATGQKGAEAVKECEDEPGSLADSTEITSTDVSGSSATVEAKLEGGEIDGETIELKMLKEQDEWKVDDLVRTEVTQGEEAESTVTNTVLNFGSSEGPKACEYLSFSKLQELGGMSGCETQFAEATAANYTATDVSVNDLKANVTVSESKQNKTIEFTLSHEAGEWKIADFEQQ